MRKDRLSKHCVFIKEVTKIPVSFCFAARSFQLKIIGGVFEDYSIENKEYSELVRALCMGCRVYTQYSLTKPNRQAVQHTILSPAVLVLHKYCDAQ